MSRMKYKITIEEMVSETFDVSSDSPEKAMDIAKRKYYLGEFVLSPWNLISKQMAITTPENELAKWTEF